MRLHLSVIVPAHNAGPRLLGSLPTIAAYLAEQGIDGEILVVDDGSTDDTAGTARKLLAGARGRVLRQPERHGRGQAIRHAVGKAQGRWILTTDADLTVPIGEHARLASTARDRDLDLVLGSRTGPAPPAKGPAAEGRIENRLARWITGIRFADPSCAFKLMDRERLAPLVGRTIVDRSAFEAELLFLAVRFGLGVEEVPVAWRAEPGSRLRDPLEPPRMLLDLLRVRWRFRRGHYRGDPS